MGALILISLVVLILIPQRAFSGVDMFPLMALPFFILAAAIMTEAKIIDCLMKFSKILVGHLRGGLAQVNVVASILFAGLTGSAISDTAALGSLLIPAMEEEGYDTGFSAAVTAASSMIGPTIPPSIIMVIYGSIMQVSIAGLFAAGIIPGLAYGVVMMIINYFIAKKRNYPCGENQLKFKKIALGLKDSIFALVLPCIILGGILFGIFTPTEAGAVAVVYGLFLGFVIFRNVKFKVLYKVIYNTSKVTAMVFLIISTASITSWFLSAERVPQVFANFIGGISTNKYVVLTLINFFVLFVGMFMDINAALIILAPILAPVAIEVGVHPLHFGFIMVFALNIGMITPPLGTCLFVASAIGDLKIEETTKAIWPFIVGSIITLFLVSFVPAISMFLPKLLGFV